MEEKTLLKTNENKGYRGFHFFSISEVKYILQTAQSCTPKIYMLCNFLWHTGVRISEALEVKPEDIDKENNKITIQSKLRRSTKYKTRLIELPEIFIKELIAYIKTNKIRKNSIIFQFTSRTALNYIKKACSIAKIKDERAHPSSFRHSYAINSLKNGFELDKVNYWLGNRDIKKTIKYLDLVEMYSENSG